MCGGVHLYSFPGPHKRVNCYEVRRRDRCSRGLYPCCSHSTPSRRAQLHPARHPALQAGSAPPTHALKIPQTPATPVNFPVAPHFFNLPKSKNIRVPTPQFLRTKLPYNVRIFFQKIRLLIQTLAIANIPTRTDICEYIYRILPCFSTYIFAPKGSKNVSEYILGNLSVIIFSLYFNFHCFSNRSLLARLYKCHSMHLKTVSFFP